MNDLKKKSTSDAILEAIQDLHAQEQIVTRETLSNVTGLKLTTIDDRIAYLLDTGKIHRVQRGVFVPAENHPPARPITRTQLPDGVTVLEVGDVVMHLTPRESRMVGELMAGSAFQFASIELGHQSAIQSGVVNARLSEIIRAMNRLCEPSQSNTEEHGAR